jgi:hypothetical protein
MELIHIYYMVFAFLSWIGCLVFGGIVLLMLTKLFKLKGE